MYDYLLMFLSCILCDRQTLLQSTGNLFAVSLFYSELLRTRFSTAYYLCKKERPYSDFCDLITPQEKNGMQASESYKNDRAAAQFIDVVGDSMRSKF